MTVEKAQTGTQLLAESVALPAEVWPSLAAVERVLAYCWTVVFPTLLADRDTGDLHLDCVELQ